MQLTVFNGSSSSHGHWGAGSRHLCWCQGSPGQDGAEQDHKIWEGFLATHFEPAPGPAFQHQVRRKTNLYVWAFKNQNCSIWHHPFFVSGLTARSQKHQMLNWSRLYWTSSPVLSNSTSIDLQWANCLCPQSAYICEHTEGQNLHVQICPNKILQPCGGVKLFWLFGQFGVQVGSLWAVFSLTRTKANMFWINLFKYIKMERVILHIMNSWMLFTVSRSS